MSEKDPSNGGDDGGKNIYNWNDIRRDVVSATPDESTFEGIYDSQTIAQDKAHINEIKHQLGVKGEIGISDSRIQEYATAEEIGEMDWFGEEQRYDQLFTDDKGEHDKGEQTIVFLTSEFDDFVNHIDAIGVIDNADSNFQPVPFALDMTYNPNFDNLQKKLSWPHPDKEKVTLPGFATAKYFEDNFHGDPPIKKGRIAIMPRFVIGYDPELAVEITKSRLNTKKWSSVERYEASAKAKWCVLTELKQQSAKLLENLEQADRNNDLLKTAYTQVQALDTYFAGALTTAQDVDQHHPDWSTYANKDAVVAAILSANA